MRIYFFVDGVLNEECVCGDVVYYFVSLCVDIEIVDVFFEYGLEI